MKKRLIILSIITASIIIVVISCKKQDKQTNISNTGDSESHNMGNNCMDCHKSGGKGKGAFQVAGTAYDSLKQSIFANVIVRLHTQSGGGGTLAATVYGDANGNFFTTESVDYTAGLYPSVEGSSGKIKYMISSASSGACNSCHGVSVDKIWVK